MSRRKCPILLTDIATGKVLSDKLYNGANQELVCEGPTCLGAMMNQDPDASVRLPSLTSTTLVEEAIKFLRQVHPENQVEERMRKVTIEIALKGTYTLTPYELEEGARLAWRNAPRCPGRASWKTLQLFDERNVSKAEDMFKCICTHISYSTNAGNIRPAITVFRGHQSGKADLRVFNYGLLGYAGYQTDSGVIGDPGNLKFTKFCESLGWKPDGPRGKWDILPLVVSGDDGIPKWFNIPQELILRVKLKHKNKDITEMGLEWYCLPAVSNMGLHVGGLEFSAAPFSGWYMSTEVSVRDLLDPHRLNLLEDFGLRLGLDTTSNSTCWKDVVALETNKMVLESFAQAGVTMVDQHSMSEQFVQHLKEEYKVRGGCPADWVWVVPPMSGSLTGTFHQELVNYHLSPSLEYQDDIVKKNMKNHNPHLTNLTNLLIVTRLLSYAYSYIWERRPKATIIYSTETGTAKRYATSLLKLLSFTFNVQLVKSDEFSVTDLYRLDRHLYAFIASTFGNGDAPLMGKDLDRNLTKLTNQKEQFRQASKWHWQLAKEHTVKDSNKMEKEKTFETNNLASVVDQIMKEHRFPTNDERSPVYFGVFGLGDSSYPTFCEFGKRIDKNLGRLQLNRVMEIGIGDVLSGQDESFKKWASSFFVESGKLFGISNNVAKEALESFDDGEILLSTKEEDYVWFKFQEQRQPKEVHSQLQMKNMFPLAILGVEDLHKEKDNRQILVKMMIPDDIEYQPGDHLGVIPKNDSSEVDYIISRVTNKPSLNSPLQLCIHHKGDWKRLENFPHGASLKEMLESYLDITTPPTNSLLEAFTKYSNDKDRHFIQNLLNNPEEYTQMKKNKFPTVPQFLAYVNSVKIPSSVLVAHLPLIKPRLYSIASAMPNNKHQLDLIVSVLEYKLNNGTSRRGLASSWLSGLKTGDTVVAYTMKSDFKLPKDSSIPIVMIGAGSGIAPLRSFWQQKMDEKKSGLEVGVVSLYSGCRSQAMMLLKEETDALATKLVFRRREAFSRENNTPKKYVQDLLEEDSAYLWDLIDEGGHIYVCGRGELAAEVQKKVVNVIKNMGDKSYSEAKNFVRDMKMSGRYCEDVFGVTFSSKNEENVKGSEQKPDQKALGKPEGNGIHERKIDEKTTTVQDNIKKTIKKMDESVVSKATIKIKPQNGTMRPVQAWQ